VATVAMGRMGPHMEEGWVTGVLGRTEAWAHMVEWAMEGMVGDTAA